MAEEKKQGLLNKLFGGKSREKADAEKAMADKKAKEVAEKNAAMAKEFADASKARAAEEARKKAAEAQADVKAAQQAAELEAKDKQEKAAKLMEEMRARDAAKAAAAAASAVASAPKAIAEYEVKGWDETLSHVALKYYGNATRPYWEVIYNANKAVVGDNPNIIKPGMVLQIPELPEELKKK